MVVHLGVHGGLDKTLGRLDLILKVWVPLKSLEEEHDHFKIVT